MFNGVFLGINDNFFGEVQKEDGSIYVLTTESIFPN